MSNNQFKNELSRISEEFSLKVIKLIQTMSVSQLASLASAKSTRTRTAQEAVVEDKPRKKPGPKPGAKAAKATVAKSGSKRGPKAEVPDKSREHRPRSYIADLRRRVLGALNDSGDWMAASQISTLVKDDDLSFVLKDFRDKGLTEMQGERSKARYKITDAGRSVLVGKAA
jgi:hypothetical protein